MDCLTTLKGDGLSLGCLAVGKVLVEASQRLACMKKKIGEVRCAHVGLKTFTM